MSLRILSVCLLSFLAACGDSTGPSNASLQGTWRFSYSNLTGAFQGATVTCGGGPFDFSITQTGSTFSGVQVSSARVTCSVQGTTVVDELIASETIVNGQISGSNVTFRLGSLAGQHSGTVTGTSMTGNAQWVFVEGNTTLTLNGNFSAAKL